MSPLRASPIMHVRSADSADSAHISGEIVICPLHRSEGEADQKFVNGAGISQERRVVEEVLKLTPVVQTRGRLKGFNTKIKKKQQLIT